MLKKLEEDKQETNEFDLHAEAQFYSKYDPSTQNLTGIFVKSLA